MPLQPSNDILNPLSLVLTNMTTTERDALVAVQAGMIIFNTTTSKINFYTGSAWEAVTSS